MDDNTNVMMDDEFGVDLSDIVDEEAQDGKQTDDVDTPEAAEDRKQDTEPTQDPAQPEANGAPDTQQPQQEPELFELKVNKGIQKVTMDQMKEYAQQGLDYGRVRQQRDSLQQSLNDQLQWRSQNEAHLNELSEVAKAAGMDIPGLISSLRVNMLVQQGMSRETAQERIRAERAERQVAANQQQAQQQAQQQRSAQAQQEQARQRQEQDVQNFLRIYSGVDPRTIPQSVWAEVRNGDTLVSAYGRYQNQQLQNQIKELNAKLEAQKQNNNNKQRSLGSVKTSGNNSQKDSFLEGFND